jgi:threonine dehydratase
MNHSFATRMDNVPKKYYLQENIILLHDVMAAQVPFKNTQRIMRQYLDDFVLVNDEDIKRAIVLLLEHTHNLAEGAGAVSLAAALQLKERLAGKKVVLVLSGGNLSLEKLRGILSRSKLTLNSFPKQNLSVRRNL